VVTFSKSNKILKNMKLRFPILVGFSMVCSNQGFAQKDKAPENWFNLDKTENSVNGVSTEKTYRELLKGKKGRTVIVAVIDGGVDPQHEDLKDIMWVNKREIPGNGIDDDKNGYIDDIHGWNFLGGKDGKNVHHETLEVTRVYAKLRTKYEKADVSKLSAKDKKEFEMYEKIKKEVEDNRNEATQALEQIEMTKTLINKALDAAEPLLKGQRVTKENIDKINPKEDQMLTMAKGIMLKLVESVGDQESVEKMREDLDVQLKEEIERYEGKAKFQYNPDLDTRKDIVKDDYSNPDDRNYGNPDVKGPDAFHGTHVAGIIGAIRTNNKGIKGVADNVQIMAVRCVPDGDERDKDVAIRYAVDNGATVINMSFGKSYSWDKNAVDRAVKYAADHDVLLIHAAGNDAKNNDADHTNFPTPIFERKSLWKRWFGKKRATNWVEVGALSWKADDKSVASFSNYGQNNVDVFSPGVDIYSTAPDGKYQNASGTSMASPVTAGVAALIRSYFPELTAEQVKECIEKSVVKQEYQVKKPGSEEKVPFSSLSRTGGTVNAFKAVQLAGQMQGKKKVTPGV
jgi:cell wall-associated protease